MTKCTSESLSLVCGDQRDVEAWWWPANQTSWYFKVNQSQISFVPLYLMPHTIYETHTYILFNLCIKEFGLFLHIQTCSTWFQKCTHNFTCKISSYFYMDNFCYHVLEPQSQEGLWRGSDSSVWEGERERVRQEDIVWSLWGWDALCNLSFCSHASQCDSQISAENSEEKSGTEVKRGRSRACDAAGTNTVL